MKWTLSNYSHKSYFLPYYRKGLPRLNFASNEYSVISQLHLMPLGMSCTINPHLSDSRGRGWPHAASFIFNHGQLAHGEWCFFDEFWIDNESVANKQK